MDSKEKTITEEYLSSLADLNVNSKPLINMLTMLADENIEYAPTIVKAVEQHLLKVPPEMKLPILYLIDSIVKNVGKQYKTLFNQSIVNIFCSVFEKVNEKVREKMYNLRQTWNDVFPQTKLYTLDVKVNLMDNNWPVTAKVVSAAVASKAPKIHVNPNFLHKQPLPNTSDVQSQLKHQEMELLALQARKLELELQATKQKLEAAKNTDHTRPDTIRIIVGDKVVSKPRPMVIQPVQMQQMPPSISGQNRQRIANVNAAMMASIKSNTKSRDPRLQRQQQISQQNHQNQVNQQNQNHQQSNDHLVQSNLPPKFYPHQQRQQPPARGPQAPHYNNMYPNQGQPVKTLPKIPKYSHNASQSTQSKSSTVTSRLPSSHRERDRKSRDESSPKSSKSKDLKSPHKSSSDESKSPRKKRSEESKDSKDKDKKTSKSPKRSSSKTSLSSKDVDLRMLSGDQPKKSRIDNNKMLNKLLLEAQESQEAGSNELGSEASKQDIDLRLLVTETKKRTSTDQQQDEPLSKKSRAEKLDDQLFGSEDVDLRSLGSTMAFSGPPPVIDGSLSKKLEAKAKNASPEAPGRSDKKKSNFEAVRAKLAEATKKSRDKATSLLIDNDQDPVIDRKRKLSESLNKKILGIDVDQREDFIQELDDDSSSGREGFNEHVQNFIRQAKEQMDAGNMDEDQYNLIVKQLVRVNDNQKTQKQNELIELSEDDSDASQRSQPAETKRIRAESSKPISEFTHATAADLRNPPFVKEKRNGTKWGPAPVWSTNQLARAVNPWEQSPFQSSVLPPTHIQPPAANVVQPQNPAALSLNNQMRTVRLNGNKDHILRFYDETAIIFDEQGQPLDIEFSAGQCMVIFDDIYQTPLNFHDPTPQPISVDGKLHMIKFGTPTRELYVDNSYYECYFNNQPTHILLDGKVRVVRINGQAPEVKICRKRMDLVLGKINLIIDAKLIIPVFLDVKMQYFELESKIHSIQFADFFTTVIINNDPYHIDFGGLPKNFSLFGEKHFLRFTALPDPLEPGKINLIGMKRTSLCRDLQTPPLMEFAVAEPGPNDLDICMLVENDIQANRDDLPQMLAATIPPMSTAPQLPNLSVMPPAIITPFVNSSDSQNIPGFGNDASTSVPPPIINLNINDLFQKLVATGILNSNDEKQKQKSGNQAKSIKKKDAPIVIERRHKILPISFSKMETIKTRQQGLVDLIYSGMQCSSCGARFPPEQTMKYSQHLDWHFRQNRRERDSQRRAHSRKWYYDCADWIRYEEIEDIEEREKNFFETQQEAQQENGGDTAQNRLDVSSIDSSVAPSCPAGRDSLSHNCAVCTDPFEQFFNNKTEEWHLRMAMKFEDKFYHPICYEEHKESMLNDESIMSLSMETTKEEFDESVEVKEIKEVKVKSEKTESDSTEPYEDDDDVVILPNEVPVVTEILDDDDHFRAEPESTTSDHVEKSDLNNITIDDDVMIQEPKIVTENLIESDDEEDIRNFDESSQTPFVVKIKEEPKDEDEDNDEDNFMDVQTIDNDFMNDENYTNSPRQGISNNVQDDNDNAMMPTERETREDSPPAEPSQSHQLDQQLINCDSSECSQPAVTAPSVPNRIKIVLSSLAQQNLTNRSSNSNNVNTDSDSLEKNKLEQNGVVVDEVVKVKPYEMPAIEYELKPQLRDVKFDKIPVPQRRGVENSGLCSIM